MLALSNGDEPPSNHYELLMVINGYQKFYLTIFSPCFPSIFPVGQSPGASLTSASWRVAGARSYESINSCWGDPVEI